MLSAEQAVKNIATENFNTYDWLSDDDLQALADGFWENRTDLEIERDKKEDVDDYYNFVEEAFVQWFADNHEELGVSGDEKEAYLEHIHRVGYESFEMFKDQWL